MLIFLNICILYIMKNKGSELVQPPLLDFTTIREDDKVKIVIYNVKHKFASDAEPSGTNITKQPIFGSRVFINNKLFSETTFGLPFMRFAQGTKPKIKYVN